MSKFKQYLESVQQEKYQYDEFVNFKEIGKKAVGAVKNIFSKEKPVAEKNENLSQTTTEISFEKLTDEQIQNIMEVYNKGLDSINNLYKKLSTSEQDTDVGMFLRTKSPENAAISIKEKFKIKENNIPDKVLLADFKFLYYPKLNINYDKRTGEKLRINNEKDKEFIKYFLMFLKEYDLKYDLNIVQNVNTIISNIIQRIRKYYLKDFMASNAKSTALQDPKVLEFIELLKTNKAKLQQKAKFSFENGFMKNFNISIGDSEDVQEQKTKKGDELTNKIKLMIPYVSKIVKAEGLDINKFLLQYEKRNKMKEGDLSYFYENLNKKNNK